MLYFCLSTKPRHMFLKRDIGIVKRQFLPAVHMTKLYCSAVHTVNPSLLPASLIKIMLRTHGSWREPPILVMANSVNMAMSLSQSKRAMSDSVKRIYFIFVPYLSQYWLVVIYRYTASMVKKSV